jgi:hypothetical protein
MGKLIVLKALNPILFHHGAEFQNWQSSLCRITQTQGTHLPVIDFKAMSAIGTSRHLAAAVKLGRFRTKADMSRLAQPATSVANDPTRTYPCNSPVAPQPPEDRHQQGYDGYRDRCHNEHAAGAKS